MDSSRYQDDAATVARVVRGDVEAFEEIVQRWQGPLLNLAHRFCRDRGMAEEMTQEAFLKIYRGLGKWRSDSRFSTWLFAVALNHYRSVMRRHLPAGTTLDDVAATLHAGDLGREMDSKMRDEAVRRAVSTLPPKYRDIVVLYYFQEMDLAETARVAELAEGTVKARLFRARKLLEQKLGGLMALPVVAPEEA